MAAVNTFTPIQRVVFDLDLLQAVLVVAECGSFTLAAARLHSTQSTVSQQVKRLEDLIGHRLLERHARGVEPTDAGRTVLAYAQQLLGLNDQLHEAISGVQVRVTVRLGLPEDFTSGKTMRALADFNRAYPQVKLEVTSGMSSDLIAAYDRGELDLILIKQRQNARAAISHIPEETAWVDSALYPAFDKKPIPLVTFPQRGVYREEIINAVESLGRAWHMSCTSSSLSGIQSAVANGMGISLLPKRAVTDEHIVLGSEQGLPVVDMFELAICHHTNADMMVKALASVLNGVVLLKS